MKPKLVGPKEPVLSLIGVLIMFITDKEIIEGYREWLVNLLEGVESL